MSGDLRTHSPCIQVCTLNAERVCVGCGRSIDDIRQWRDWSDIEKDAWWTARQESSDDALEQNRGAA